MDNFVENDKEKRSFMFEVKLLKWSVIFLLYLGINVVQATGLVNIIPDMGTLRDSSFAIFLLFPLFILSLKKGIKYRKQDLNSIVILLIICIFNAVTNRDANWGPTVTSLFLPFMFSFVLFGIHEFDKKVRQMIFKMLMSYFLLSCSLAVIERVLGLHLFEYSKGIELGVKFRSYAFGGHPLANAVVISTILNFLWITEMAYIKKMRYSILGFVALFCFNTRFAIVVTGFFFCIFLWHLLKDKQVSFILKQRILGICLVGGIVFHFLIFHTSFGGRLVDMGLYDDESASARLQMLLVFDKYTFSDFVWGMTWNETTEMMHSSGVYGVINENPWLIFLFRFGMIFMLIIIATFFVLFKQLMKDISLYEKSIIVFPMLLIISSFNSIGVGSIVLSVWVLCCYAFLPSKKANNEYHLLRS